MESVFTIAGSRRRRKGGKRACPYGRNKKTGKCLKHPRKRKSRRSSLGCGCG